MSNKLFSSFKTHPLLMILAGYTVLALAYNFAQPPFEPSDEQYQFGYIHYLIEHQQLPVAQRGELTGYHHPPLYFMLAALVAAPFPASDLPEYETRINPYARYRHWEPSVDNKNLYLHGPWDGWPFRETSLAVHVTRLFSLLCGLITILATYQLTHTLFDDAVALAAAGLVAFTPMFTSLSGALQNDLGATAVGAVLLWLAVHFAQTGFTVRRAVLLGLVGGAGVLMKLTAAFLLPPVVWLLAVSGWRVGRPQRVFTLLAAFSASLMLVTGWWFIRNWLLYGEPFALSINLENFGGQTTVWDGVKLWPEMLPYAWTTFWGRIGHGGIVLPDWIYQIIVGVTVMGGLGFLRVRAHSTAITFLWLAALSCFLGLMLYITLSPTGANGRYAYPALPAYMSLLAAGLLSWVPTNLRRNTAIGVAGAMFVFSSSVLAFFVAPAYAPPPAVAQLPANAMPLNTRLWDIAVIRGYTFEAPPTTAKTLTLTVYWEPLNRTDLPYSVFVHLIDAQTETLIAQRDTYPGLGRYPTTAWAPGQLFADRYQVILPEEVVVERAYWKVGLWQAETGDRAWVLDTAGEPVDSGQRLAEFTWPLPAR